jgi:putative PIN family toxin of toxin-antitoxin system
MKIVFDTNVILSALITNGLSSRVLNICIDKHQLFISPWIIDEVLLKLDVKMHIAKLEIERVYAFLNNVFNNFVPQGDPPAACRDNDNNIISLAKIIEADIIIAGDNDLLLLKDYFKTKIISPRQFIEKYYKPE